MVREANRRAHEPVDPGYVSTGHLPPPDLVQALVDEAYRRFKSNTDGHNAEVYPALARVPSDLFGICVAGIDGSLFSAGDATHDFPIMSVSKPFVFALVCDAIGAEEARRRIGVNATGLPFNSLAAVERAEDGRTNPMVNPGAIATTNLAPGDDAASKWRFIHRGLCRFAGRTLAIDEEVYDSASRTNHQNQSIARLLRALNRIDMEPAAAVDLYTRQCSLSVSAADLAVMGATLADGGVNPMTGERVVSAAACHCALAVMVTAGLYETSGDWLYQVGLPGKSGIGGGIVTVSPGKGGLGTFAPPLDSAGNSVKGQLVARFLSQHLGMDLLASRPADRAAATQPGAPATKQPAPPNGRPVRIERDSLGPLEVPADAYWGINTARALENFPISGRPISEYRDLIVGLACVKQAAARANAEIGALAPEKARLIDAACEEIRRGGLLDQFVVDIMQGGAGTSMNMNANEVIANRALELAGHPRGRYDLIDPNDDVNRSQSTNDVYPTAVRIGLCTALERLLAELARLAGAFRDKGAQFAGIVKVGRTQLQDAVPMTLKQEFDAFAATLLEDHAHLERVLRRLWEVNLGGTAIGTGIAADPGYAAAAARHLSQITGYDIVTAPDLIEATTDVGAFMDLSSALRRTAVKLSKICNDLRLLSSGPQAGLGEIRLPPRQAGSSIMPGKVNPVIPEAVNSVAFTVVGHDVTVGLAAEAGQLQLNAFLPVMAHALFESLDWMTAAMATLRVNCVTGIAANRERLAAQVGSFVGVVTALIPHIGYKRAGELARKALETNARIADLVAESGILSREQVASLMSPERLAGESAPSGGGGARE
jgi:aspartate ammonia-lyase